jgi:hypothetical protein
MVGMVFLAVLLLIFLAIATGILGGVFTLIFEIFRLVQENIVAFIIMLILLFAIIAFISTRPNLFDNNPHPKSTLKPHHYT